MVAAKLFAVAAMALIQSAVAAPDGYGYDKATTVYKYKVSKLPNGGIPILDG